MPRQLKFDNFKDDVFIFNNKYKLDFSFEEFEKGVLKLKNIKRFLGRSKGNSISPDDAIYRGTYEKLYKQAINNVIDKKIAPFDYSTLLNDFEDLMKHYRTVCRSTNRTMPSERGAWTKESDVIKSAQKKLNEINENKQASVEERYQKGKLRIRDMRAHAQELADKREDSVEKLSALLNYANALENTNKNRPLWWRAMHLIRNNAEKKYAEQIRQTAKELLGDNLAEAEAMLKQQDASKLKSDINDLLAEAIAKEENSAPTNNVKPETKVETQNISKENIVRPETVTEVSESKTVNDDLKPVPIKVNINDVNRENDKSLADLSAKERVEKLKSSTAFNKEMLKEIMSCLNASPLSDNEKRSKAMNQIYEDLMDHAQDMAETYDESVESEESFSSIDDAMKTFSKTMFGNAYEALNGFKIPSEKKLVAAQKIANIFLTKATPVGFYPNKFGKYANNYAIKDRDDVKYRMKNDAEHTINEALYDSIIDDTMKELGSREKYTVEYTKVKIDESEDSKKSDFNAIDFNKINLDDIPDEDVPTFWMRKQS